MSYSVGPELQEYIATKIKSGEYQNQSEVVRDALRKMKRDDELHQLRLTELDHDLEVGAQQLARGERVTPEASRRRRRTLLDTEATG